jgi:hypothetical protein
MSQSTTTPNAIEQKGGTQHESERNGPLEPECVIGNLLQSAAEKRIKTDAETSLI